jgi:hypothetical protein
MKTNWFLLIYYFLIPRGVVNFMILKCFKNVNRKNDIVESEAWHTFNSYCYKKWYLEKNGGVNFM